MGAYNCVIFELAYNHSRDALLYLQTIQMIKIVKWLGNNDDGSGVISTYYSDILMEDELKKESVICNPSVYKKVYERLYVFLDMFSRCSELPIYEKVNMFNLYVNYYYGLFSKNKVDFVMFGDIPHFGVDSVAYDVARAMNIKCILTLPTHEANRFWCVNSLEDIGYFNSIKNTGFDVVEIEEKYEKCFPKLLKKLEEGKPIYKIDLKHICMRYFSLFLEKCKTEGINTVVNKGISFVLGKGQRKLRELSYLDEALIYTAKTVDFNKKYIYFPLQLQPEQTTSAQGGAFCDQILAIERLLRIIPDDWFIYVKENPRQTCYMRQSMFFRRLSLLNNVLYVGKEVDTHKLIDNSQFVATITGTAGWEAISSGKCAVVFGYTWYRKLPGVFEYNSDLTLREILAYEVDVTEVKDKYKKLLNKSFKGVMQAGWTQDIVKNYSDESNIEYLKDSFKRIISITMK